MMKACASAVRSHFVYPIFLPCIPIFSLVTASVIVHLAVSKTMIFWGGCKIFLGRINPLTHLTAQLSSVNAKTEKEKEYTAGPWAFFGLNRLISHTL